MHIRRVIQTIDAKTTRSEGQPRNKQNGNSNVSLRTGLTGRVKIVADRIYKILSAANCSSFVGVGVMAIFDFCRFLTLSPIVKFYW